MSVVVVALVAIVAVLGGVLIGLEAALTQTERRLNRLRAFNEQALRLAEARGRFRRGQKRFERMVDAGTAGMESAHRSVAGPDYRGAPFYGGLRTLNRSLGRRVSDWLAPRSTLRRRESLAEWRARRERDDDAE